MSAVFPPLDDQGFAAPHVQDSEVARLRIPPHSVEAESSVLGGLLLDNNACVDEASDDGHAPLHVACLRQNVRCVLTLLAAGADVHGKHNDGSTALHFAAAKIATIVPILVAVGAGLDAVNQDSKPARQILADRGVQVDLSDVALERARRDIAKARLDFVRHRALQVCIGLQSLRLDALQMCKILQQACGPLARLIAFHQWWNIATTVKHFRD